MMKAEVSFFEPLAPTTPFVSGNMGRLMEM
jgi:hypothetical protein